MIHDEDELVCPDLKWTWKDLKINGDILEEAENLAFGHSVCTDRLKGLVYHMHELLVHGGDE